MTEPVPAEERPAQRLAWILYDGRAEAGDTDCAQVMEFVGHTKREVKRALWYWKGYDGVLVEYDIEGENTLVNERIIGHLREGKRLLDRISKAEGNGNG